MRTFLCSLVLSNLLFCFAVNIAEARQWNATPEAMAQDYLIIQDARAANDFVVLIWVAPELIAAQQGAEAARTLLSENLVMGAAHILVDNQGRFTAQQALPPELATFNGTRVSPIDQGRLSPSAHGTIESFKSVFSQALGTLGKGLSWYVYDGTSVPSCQAGGLSVRFEGTDYTYKTPIPGCK